MFEYRWRNDPKPTTTNLCEIKACAEVAGERLERFYGFSTQNTPLSAAAAGNRHDLGEELQALVRLIGALYRLGMIDVGKRSTRDWERTSFEETEDRYRSTPQGQHTEAGESSVSLLATGPHPSGVA